MAEVEKKPEEKTSKTIESQSKRDKRTRPTRAETIKQQANPASRLAGQQKTIRLKLKYQSDILHEYLQLNQSTMLAAYERLGALLRLCASSTSHMTEVNEWIDNNIKVSQSQISEIVRNREIIVSENDGYELDVDVIVPESYETTFEASHPVVNKMIAILRIIDTELNESEILYFAGVIDDTQYADMRKKAAGIVRSNIDRIFKATSPGVRNGGRFTPSQLFNWLKQGNKLFFADLPQEFQETEVANA